MATFKESKPNNAIDIQHKEWSYPSAASFQTQTCLIYS